MARTKGAKDNRPRKKPKRSHSEAAGGRTPAPPSRSNGPPAVLSSERIDPGDFDRAVEAVLGSDALQPTAQDPPPAGVPSPDPQSAAPAAGMFDPATVSLEAWQAVWELPFWILGRLLQAFRVIPDSKPIELAGKRRAKDLAKPSYMLWEHYANQYAGMDPLNPLHLSIGATALVGLTCVRDVGQAIVDSRRQPEAPVSPPEKKETTVEAND